ncbi:MAG: hypothetical protein AB1801_23830 [Chloroflexota bacterium]
MTTSESTDRLSIINALLIALVTLIGAYVAWRASVAADNAGDASLAGLVSTLNVQETLALNNAELYENYRAYTAYTRYNELGYQIEADLKNASTEEAEVLDRQMREAWDTAESFYFPREYLKRNGSYDTERELGETFAEAARQKDLNPQPYYDEADKMQTRSNRLIMVITGLAVGLLCFTLVESLNSRALKYIFMSLGLIITVAGVIATIAIDHFLFI